MKKETILISAFPGIGKTYFYQNAHKKKVLDSDSSKFDKSKFPDNYIQHIKKNIDKVDIILISSHDMVREALVNEGLEFILVFPDYNLKEEYIKRFKKRGSTEEFIKLVSKNWHSWIKQLYGQKGCKHIILKSGQYLSDVL